MVNNIWLDSLLSLCMTNFAYVVEFMHVICFIINAIHMVMFLPVSLNFTFIAGNNSIVTKFHK